MLRASQLVFVICLLAALVAASASAAQAESGAQVGWVRLGAPADGPHAEWRLPRLPDLVARLLARIGIGHPSGPVSPDAGGSTPQLLASGAEVGAHPDTAAAQPSVAPGRADAHPVVGAAPFPRPTSTTGSPRAGQPGALPTGAPVPPARVPAPSRVGPKPPVACPDRACADDGSACPPCPPAPPRLPVQVR